MAARIALDVVLTLVITVVLAWIALALFSLVDAVDPITALIDDAPRLLFGLMGVPLAVWSLLLIVGAVLTRRRGAGWRIATHLVTLTLSIVAMLIVLTAQAFGGPGGWGLLLVAIALAPALAVGLAGTIAVLLVQLGMRRRRSSLPADTPASAAVVEVD